MHNFLADLGGLLGLYLGGSAISLFEIIDLIVYNLALQMRFKTAAGAQKKRGDRTSEQNEDEAGSSRWTETSCSNNNTK